MKFFSVLSIFGVTIGFLLLGILVLEKILFFIPHYQFNYAKVDFASLPRTSKTFVEVACHFPFFSQQCS
jgi:hypothetical protein